MKWNEQLQRFCKDISESWLVQRTGLARKTIRSLLSGRGNMDSLLRLTENGLCRDMGQVWHK